ncbi:hypothetical protein ZORO111902_09520 [Zobellia roscoffensis]
MYETYIGFTKLTQTRLTQIITPQNSVKVAGDELT